MDSRRRFLVAASLTPFVGGCGLLFGSWEVRYRLNITLERGGREYAGAGVLQTRWTSNGPFAGFGGGVDHYNVATWGDAIIVDMGPFGLVFALLRSPGNLNGQRFNAIRPEYPLQRALREQASAGEDVPSFHTAAWFDAIKKMRGAHEIREAHWPALVNFRDINDQTTVELVAPESGVTIRRVTIEVTSDSVTRGIRRRLPWLRRLRRSDHPNLARVEDGFDREHVATHLDSRAFTLSGDEYP